MDLMAPGTSLNFYRKRQTFSALGSERPQSLQSVYNIAREVVASVQGRLLNLEMSYYGPGGTVESQAKQWHVPLQLILRPARLSGLVSLQQLTDISERHSDSTDILTVDEESLNTIQTLVNKTIKTVREGFSEPIYSLTKLLEYMKKYCLSFSQHEGEAYLETATNYEKQRRDLEHAIRSNLENITVMADKFEKESLHVQHFDQTMKEMSERYRVEHSPIAMLFTVACSNLRNACKGLLMWVEADMAYPEFLSFDIKDLEKKKEQQTRLYREAQMKASMYEFSAKSLKKSISEGLEEMKKLRPKQKVLQDEEKKLREANKEVLEDLNIKEYRKLEMKINGSVNDRETQEQFERLQTEIIDLKTRKPAIERRLTDLEKQQTWIKGREVQLQQKQEALEKVLQELKLSRKLARKAEVELEALDTCIAKLKEIYLLKASNETLKKIFHNMPVYSKINQGLKKKKDGLERLCRFVEAEIGPEWSRLYRCLPFYPSRGVETISSDIDDISCRFLRNTQEQAHHALSRWRRMHTRACVADLRDALVSIRRKDVVEKYDQIRRAKLAREKTTSPRIYRMVHFPKLNQGAKKIHNYLDF